LRAASARLQLSGDRFVLRRIEAALLGADPGAVEHPARAVSLAVGCLLAALLLAAGVLTGWLRPPAGLGDAPIVLGTESGALYVRVGDTLHPVLNLASARLIAGADAAPRPVREAALGRARRGPLLGIPGAPGPLGPPVGAESGWAVCDTGAATAVIVEPAPGAWLRPPPLLVTADSGDSQTYLLAGGHRTVVDRADPHLVRPVSPVLLEAVPEAPPTPAATVPDRPLGPDAPVLCVLWAPATPADVAVLAGAGLPLPPGAAPVGLAQADGSGPALDAVYLPAGHTAFVRAGGARYLVADTGVRFAVPDDAAARSLGLPGTPTPAPWPMLAALPHGPELSRPDALVARDVVAVQRPS
jgi:hypothetical protein